MDRGGKSAVAGRFSQEKKGVRASEWNDVEIDGRGWNESSAIKFYPVDGGKKRVKEISVSGSIIFINFDIVSFFLFSTLCPAEFFLIPSIQQHSTTALHRHRRSFWPPPSGKSSLRAIFKHMPLQPRLSGKTCRGAISTAYIHVTYTHNRRGIERAKRKINKHLFCKFLLTEWIDRTHYLRFP